jgi:hypothetical protein
MAYYTSEAIGAGAAMGTGLTMSADGRIVAMGAPNHSSNAGLVCVFINCDITPLLVQSFSNFTANDYFGQYLSFTSDASLLLIGSSFTSTTIGTRKTYMYYRTYGNLYTLYKSISPALNNYDRYGFGTAISGNGALVIIGFEPNAATNTYGQLEIYNYPEASRICMNATFYAPAGSAAAPSYSFGREPGTGLFMPMVDTIGASINGTHVLNFTAYGLIPAADNVVSLGTNSKKFSNVYCTNSTINTSDARLKIWTECDRGMDFIKEVKTYKYKINNRDSLGLIAQDFINEFDSTEAILERGEYYGLRYSEFIPIIVKAIQEYYNKN